MPRECSIDTCTRPHRARGYCGGHYTRWLHGKDLNVPMRTDPLDVRVRGLIEQGDGCWRWLGHLTSSGYGSIWRGGQHYRAHRVAYEIFVGPIPEGLVIDHLCRNRGCVNPAHMEPVTPHENWRRGESVTVKHARKTHCKWGHPFDDANTRYRPSGARRCRICHGNEKRRYRTTQKYRDQRRARRQKKREARRANRMD